MYFYAQLKKEHRYITPEFKMVLAILKNILHQKNEALPRLSIDNKKILYYLASNNLNAYVAASAHQFPELKDIKSKIWMQAKRSLRTNLALQVDLLKVIDLAQKNNIQLLLFKGHPVNEWIYGHNHLRTSTDVDVCIPPKDIPVFEKLLLEKGYINDRPTFSLNEKEFAVFLKIDNEKSYSSPTKTKLDVHFKLFKNPYLLVLPEDNSACIIEDTYYNKKIFRLNDAYTLLYLMVHGKIHYWGKMMWLVDIAKLTQKLSQETLQEAFHLAQKNKLEPLFLATLSLCNIALEMPIPHHFAEKINNKHAKYVMQGMESLSGKQPSKISQWQQRVFMKKDFRFFFYQISLFPLRDMNIVKIPFAKRLLYPLLRPITYLLS